MLNLTLQGVEVFIKRSQTKGQEIFWDNYDLMIWKQNSNGFTDINGMFRKNSWGIVNRIPINNNGNWELPIKYVRYFR